MPPELESTLFSLVIVVLLGIIIVLGVGLIDRLVEWYGIRPLAKIDFNRNYLKLLRDRAMT